MLKICEMLNPESIFYRLYNLFREMFKSYHEHPKKIDKSFLKINRIL